MAVNWAIGLIVLLNSALISAAYAKYMAIRLKIKYLITRVISIFDSPIRAACQ